MAKRSGLGRSLHELLGEESKPAPQQSLAQTLPVEFLSRGKYQPRGEMNTDALQELAESIKAQGLIQPIIVRGKGEHYEIIAGERRWRAAQLAGLTDVPVVIRDISDEQAMAMALIENIQREDLNPMEEARALQRLSEELHSSHQSIATAIGKSRAHVSNLIRLNQCHPEVQTLLGQGKIEMGHARALLALPTSQQLTLAQLIVAKHYTVRATEHKVKQMLAGTKTQPATRSTDIRHLEDKLSTTLAAKVNIKHQASGKGQLSIHYNSLDELEGILDHIK
jgi:ParB family transcriptional regulator, chromosome partitioning protein